MSRAYAEAKKASPNKKKATILKDLSPVYERPGRTKQSFKDSCDINKIMIQAGKTGTISHLQKHGAMYGDFTDIPDLLEAHDRLRVAEEIFNELPGEVKRDFNQSASEFFAFVNDPANVDDLKNLLPKVAEAGDYIPEVNRVAGLNTGGPEEAVAGPGDSTPVPDEGVA